MRTIFLIAVIWSVVIFHGRSHAQSACQQLGGGCNNSDIGHMPHGGSSTDDHEDDTPLGPSNVDKAWDVVHDAREAKRAGNYKLAVEYYKQAIHMTRFTVSVRRGAKVRGYIEQELEDAQEALNAQEAGELWKYQAARDINKKGNEAARQGDYSEAAKCYAQALMYYPDDSIYRSNFKHDLEELRKRNRQAAEQAEHYGKQAITQAKVFTQREKVLFDETVKLRGKLKGTNDPVEKSNIQAKIEHVEYAKALADKATTRFVTGWGEPSVSSSQDLIEVQKLSDQAFKEAMQDAKNFTSPSPWLYGEPRNR